MDIFENESFDQERAFYGAQDILVRNCRIDGPADGESAFKECRDVTVENSFFNLRYPFWHDDGLSIENCEMTELCRASLWYSKNVSILNSRLHGIKALRECSDIRIEDCDIVSPEFGWSSSHVLMKDTKAQSEYFMLRGSHLVFERVNFTGKYSFQYIHDSVFDDCHFDTKDAFWHAKNLVIRNSVIKGEYLAWYSENLTFINCTIVGTQPLCYCKGLKLINCRMIDTDLAFERSEADATLTEPILSIKNPLKGTIRVPSAKEIIRDIEGTDGKVIFTEENVSAIR